LICLQLQTGEVIKIEKIVHKRANIGRTTKALRQVCSGQLSYKVVNPARVNRPVGKETHLDGYKKLKPKVNHRMLFAMLNSIDIDVRKDHYTMGQENLVLYDINGDLIGGF